VRFRDTGNRACWQCIDDGHVQIHQCEHCSRTFENSLGLSNEDRFICHQCGVACDSCGELVYHRSYRARQAWSGVRGRTVCEPCITLEFLDASLEV
jgi:formylmethanofuran dehydrogenase subunit E